MLKIQEDLQREAQRREDALKLPGVKLIAQDIDAERDARISREVQAAWAHWTRLAEKKGKAWAALSEAKRLSDEVEAEAWQAWLAAEQAPLEKVQEAWQAWSRLANRKTKLWVAHQVAEAQCNAADDEACEAYRHAESTQAAADIIRER